MSDDWRPVVAALAHPQTRDAYAALVRGDASAFDGLAPSRRRTVEDTLVRSGLATRRADGQLVIVSDVFSRLLAAQPATPRVEGVARFLDAEGRIDRYPTRAGERGELFERVVNDVLDAAETVTEGELNQRLARWTTDIPLLRRALVDDGLLERTASGSAYSRR